MPHDWRDSLRLAADLALLGIVVTLLSLPLLTAGAAVATGSHAIRHLITHGRWPSFADCWAVFRRRLLPGLVAGPAVAAGTVLVMLDIAGLRRGTVPGGGPALAAVVTAAALLAGYVALIAVESGTIAPPTLPSANVAPLAVPSGNAAPAARPPANVAPLAVRSANAAPEAAQSSTAVRGATRSALSLALTHPITAVAAAAILAVAALLASLVHPALVPVLAGYVLFALHVVTPKAAGRPLTSTA